MVYFGAFLGIILELLTEGSINFCLEIEGIDGKGAG
jgi:hypothetical protein